MKSHGFLQTLRALYAGQSLTRIRMNYALAKHTLRGRVLDVGGGRNPDYFAYLRRAGNVSVEAVDHSLTGIDFEKDLLPYGEHTFDTVLACNVLEHVYNHQFLLREIHRVLMPRGTLIGFVPFWTGYHPDPHDFFRYTDEALTRMLTEAGFKNVAVERIGGGPLVANFNTTVLSVPRIFRPVLFMIYATADRMFVSLRPQSVLRNPLGFLFTATCS